MFDDFEAAEPKIDDDGVEDEDNEEAGFARSAKCVPT